jgi:DNA-binding MarR family transcriptional regulator
MFERRALLKRHSVEDFDWLIHEIVGLLDARTDKSLRDEVGMSLRQYWMMKIIQAYSPISNQAMLADRLHIGEPAVSRHIRLARQRHWIRVETSRISGRQKTITITAQGHNILDRARSVVKGCQPQGFYTIEPEDLSATMRSLRRLHTRLITR